MGKTSFAAHAPKTFFLLSPGETGLHTLIDSGQLPPVDNLEIHRWEDLLAIIDELTKSPIEYQTIVFDTIDGFEKLANRFVTDTHFKGDDGEGGFIGYQRGYKVVANGPWRELLKEIDRLRSEKRVGIILLAHTGVINFQNPNGPDYNRYTPGMNKESWELTQAWADIVLFGQPEVVVAKDKADRKSKGRGVSGRVMYTEFGPIADAKNRHGLASEIEMGNSGKECWDNFKAALVAAKAAGKEAV